MKASIGIAARDLFSHDQYVNLEELDQRRFVIEDPPSFSKTIINGQENDQF